MVDELTGGEAPASEICRFVRRESREGRGAGSGDSGDTTGPSFCVSIERAGAGFSSSAELEAMFWCSGRGGLFTGSASLLN